MNEVLAITLQSMQADMARLDQVGMNLANVLTPGYKRSVAVQAPVTGFTSLLAATPAGQSPSPAAVPGVRFVPDMRAGTLRSTGQPLDLAITGKGYFEVMTPSGLAYTRQGDFRLDARGKLVTNAGHAVMGVAGEITLDSANAAVSASGKITSASTQSMLGQLKIVQFGEAAMPERLGDGLFAAAPGMTEVPESEAQLRQGWLENSNAASTLEMGSLVQAMRHFEGMQKVVQGYDEMLGLAIRKLGDAG
jgi:flagellar basal-body rod protein FlgG